jgi:hypothetical protein
MVKTYRQIQDFMRPGVQSSIEATGKLTTVLLDMVALLG